MTDSLTLAARLAASLFVDAIELAKPGARLAARVGHRVLGGNPFNEREAQRFLTMGGAERLLNEAEAERDVYEPDPLWSAARVREQEELMSVQLPDGTIYTDYIDNVATTKDLKRAHDTMASVCRAIDELGLSAPVGTVTHGFIRTTTPSNPADAGDTGPGIDGATSAPGTEAPVAVESPESAPAPPLPGADSGHSITSDELKYLQSTTLIEPRSEHPQYAQIQDCADAAVVADVLGDHYYFRASKEFGTGPQCLCGERLTHVAAWQRHVAPFIVQALQQ